MERRDILIRFSDKFVALRVPEHQLVRLREGPVQPARQVVDVLLNNARIFDDLINVQSLLFDVGQNFQDPLGVAGAAGGVFGDFLMLLPQ